MFLTFLGTVASSKKTTAAIPSQSWSVYVDCADLQNSNTVYTQQGVSITVGPIYTNESLTTPYANAGFVYTNNRYSTDGSGTPTSLGGCPNIIPVYNECDKVNVIAYTRSPTETEVTAGITLYTDDALTTTYNNASFYAGNSATNFYTDGSGTVFFNSYCYSTYTTYSDCTSAGAPIVVNGFYNIPLSAGEYAFQNTTLTTPVANTSFVYQGRRLTTNSDGLISDQSPATCPAYITSVYTNCDKDTVQATLRSTNPLGDLVTVFTDDALNNTYSNQSFVYGTPPKQYNTSSGGVMDSGTFCVRTWGSYATCDNERDAVNSVDYYTRYPDATLQVGVVVYSNNTATTVLADTTFIRSGTIYTTDGSGSINSTSSCYYSIPTANTCGGVHNSGYVYTNSTATNATGLYNAGAIIYGSYPTPLTNATVYVAGDTHYIMTNSSGVAATLIQCTT